MDVITTSAPATREAGAFEPAVDALRTRIVGEVLSPGTAACDEARGSTFLAVDRHPAVIVRPAHDSDVAAAVAFARHRATGGGAQWRTQRGQYQRGR